MDYSNLIVKESDDTYVVMQMGSLRRRHELPGDILPCNRASVTEGFRKAIRWCLIIGALWVFNLQSLQSCMMEELLRKCKSLHLLLQSPELDLDAAISSIKATQADFSEVEELDHRFGEESFQSLQTFNVCNIPGHRGSLSLQKSTSLKTDMTMYLGAQGLGIIIIIIITIPDWYYQWAAERTFSCMKRIKTWLRTIMLDEHVRDLALIAVLLVVPPTSSRGHIDGMIPPGSWNTLSQYETKYSTIPVSY
ncbi:hypothetical protein FOZ63_005688 [Perkinsus olseni]|uniref:Uncharacterized protein n=1 Tax=Perkinsus olseni TaxID=32597 RepID=A0A7J6RBY5_PEROL|nr:hypothetical protein FOZ63_005688 [Perkinsus olseni]KAF4718178.1 hypothetical protein FOZ62_004922 [Perkinsus olseni]